MKLRRQQLGRGAHQSPHQLGQPKSEGPNPPAEPHKARQSYARLKPEHPVTIKPNPDLIEVWEEPEQIRSRLQRVLSWLRDRAI